MEKQPFDFWRPIRTALMASVAGSFVGALIFWLVIELVLSGRLGRELSLDEIWIGALLTILTGVAGSVGTVPVMLIVGLPLTWPIRRQIGAHPLLSLVPLAALGAVSGRLLYAAFDTSLSTGQYVDAASCIGTATAIVGVFMLRKLHVPSTPTALDQVT